MRLIRTGTGDGVKDGAKQGRKEKGAPFPDGLDAPRAGRLEVAGIGLVHETTVPANQQPRSHSQRTEPLGTFPLSSSAVPG